MFDDLSAAQRWQAHGSGVAVMTVSFVRKRVFAIVPEEEFL